MCTSFARTKKIATKRQQMDDEQTRKRSARVREKEGQGLKGDDSLPGQTFSAMLQPRVCTIRTVLPELYPLLAKSTKYSVWFNLSHKRICPKSSRSLFGISPARLMGWGEISRCEVLERGRGRAWGTTGLGDGRRSIYAWLPRTRCMESIEITWASGTGGCIIGMRSAHART